MSITPILRAMQQAVDGALRIDPNRTDAEIARAAADSLKEIELDVGAIVVDHPLIAFVASRRQSLAFQRLGNNLLDNLLKPKKRRDR